MGSICPASRTATMPPKEAAQFTFVNVSNPATTRRAAHLQLAQIRSHNTRLHHQQRREQSQGERSTSRRRLPSTPSPQPPTCPTPPGEDSLPPRTLQLQLRQHAPLYHDPHQHLPGSSDPFDSFGDIQITPEMNSLLQFIQRRYLPCLYVGPASLRLCRHMSYTYSDIEQNLVAGASLVVREFRRGVLDPNNTPGWFASHLPRVFPLLPEGGRERFREMAARFYVQSCRQLRQDIGRYDQSDAHDISLVTQIVHMFRAEVMEDQPDSARAHAWALRRIGDFLGEDPYLAVDLFMVLMFNDSEYTVHHMHPPLLDYDHWLNQRLEPHWDRAEADLPDVGTEYQNVDKAASFPIARSALQHLRRVIAFINQGMPMTSADEVARVEVLYIWSSNRTLHDSVGLIQRFLELMEAPSSDDQEQEALRYIEAAMSLTIVYLIRKTIHMAMYEEQDLRDASHVIAPRLKDTVIEALQTCTPEQLYAYQRAFFWMFFCGAHYEEQVRVGHAMSSDPPTGGWFQQMLVMQASQLGILRWEAAEAALSPFLYSDLLPLNTATWFLRLVRPLVESEDDFVEGTAREGSWQEPYY